MLADTMKQVTCEEAPGCSRGHSITYKAVVTTSAEREITYEGKIANWNVLSEVYGNFLTTEKVSADGKVLF